MGTGNAGPFDQSVRNPAGGDALFISSILAIRPDSGRLAWHYQTTPGDNWDFTATQNMVLADIVIGGELRKVLMQAPKNGFFYVLDRATGELISAKNYVRVNWASGIDPETGRPVPSGIGDYGKASRFVFPSPYGGHNWQPMAYNPETGLVYIPARDIGWVWGADTPGWFYSPHDLKKYTDEDVLADTRGVLMAWDPVNQRPAWQVDQNTITNGGVLTTGGNLVVQGTEDGYLQFYTADRGELLRQFFIGTGIVAPPVSYAVDGEQFIAFATGWNGVKTQPEITPVETRYENSGRMIVLKLGGGNIPVASKVPAPPFYPGDETGPRIGSPGA